MRKLMIIAGLVVAVVLSSGPLTALADEQQKKQDSAEAKKDGKESKETEEPREGINKIYDSFKQETSKGKKNLNDLYQRSTTTQKDEKEK